MIMHTLMLGVMVVSMCLLASCGRKQKHQHASAGSEAATITLTGAGATIPYPLYSKWFDMYKETNPGVNINYQSIGSGGGIQQLKAGTVDFGASDAPLSDVDLKGMPAPVIQIPMTAGAVVLAYNLPNVPTGLKLSPDVIADIFLGTISKWNDPRLLALNAGAALRNLGITIAHRAEGSGTTNIVTGYLSAISPIWATKVGTGKSVNWPVGIGGKGNEGVAGVLKQTPGAFGYVELAYAQQNALHIASIRNKAGEFITPDVASTTAAADAALEMMKKDNRTPIVNSTSKEAYPICGFTYILIYKEQSDEIKGTTVVNFLWWAIHDGLQYCEPLFYAPLPDGVISLNETLLNSITSKGKPLHTATPQ